MEGIKLQDIRLLIWDDYKNFNLENTQRLLGNNKLYRLSQFNSEEEFKKIWDGLNEDELLVFCCHVNYKDFSSYFDFQNSQIFENYNIPIVNYISSGDSGEAMQKLNKIHGQKEKIILYNDLKIGIKANIIKTFTKKEITGKILLTPLDNSNKQDLPTVETSKVSSIYPRIKYAIITALYKDEFEELSKIFDFPEELRIKTKKKIFYRGYLKSNKAIEVVAAIPNSTGMVDSSIIATQMLEFFRPDYLLMSGVCGGGEDLKFGDVVLAKQIFIFQKGKISDLRVKDEEGNYVKIDLYDNARNIVDYNHLFDNEGNQISISIEKFEVEHDTIIQLDTFFEDSLNPKLDLIIKKINEIIQKETFFAEKKTIKIVVEPMACSTMIINKEGYFEDTIKSIHRKTSAVEMESYGVARACQYANNGKTIPLIFKSVMDKTVYKADTVNGINVKKFAAFTSAQFMKLLFEENII